MNTDFRISVTCMRHPKIRKLTRRLGYEAFYNLVCLWAFCAAHKPDGVLAGMTAEDIELAAEWNGEPDVLVRTLVELRLLDADEAGEVTGIHDWREHNGYAFYANARTAKARNAASARWGKSAEHMPDDAPSNAQTENEHMPDDAPSNAQTENEHMPDDAPSNAPTPTPTPTPAPYSEKDFCAEPASPPAAPPPQPDGPVPKPALVFPLAGKGETFAVTEVDIAEWQESFPGVDVPQALRHCLQWNRDNPNRRKTRNGIRRHITGWLAKAQNEARASPPGNNRPQYPQPMTARQRYMHELGEAIFPEPDEEPRHEPIDITPAPRQLEPPARPAATPGRAAP